MTRLERLFGSGRWFMVKHGMARDSFVLRLKHPFAWIAWRLRRLKSGLFPCEAAFDMQMQPSKYIRHGWITKSERERELAKEGKQ